MQTKTGKSLLARIFRTPTPLMERKPLCSGAASGWQCVHYAPRGAVQTHYQGELHGEVVRLEDEPEFTKNRRCILPGGGVVLPNHPAQLPSYCPHYQASRRRFDPLFEIPPPRELSMPAMIAGGAQMGTPDIGGMILGSEGPNAPKNWDETPGAPVLPREPGDAPDAPARRGFIHCEVEDAKTACSRKAPLVKVARLIPADMEKTLAQVNCPGCLMTLATNIGVKTIVANRCKALMDRLEAEANKAHESTSDAATESRLNAAINEAAAVPPDQQATTFVNALFVQPPKRPTDD